MYNDIAAHAADDGFPADGSHLGVVLCAHGGVRFASHRRAVGHRVVLHGVTDPVGAASPFHCWAWPALG